MSIFSSAEEVKLPAHPVKTGQARQGLPGNVDMIIGSAFLPAIPLRRDLPAGRQGGASSRLARGLGDKKNPDIHHIGLSRSSDE